MVEKCYLESYGQTKCTGLCSSFMSKLGARGVGRDSDFPQTPYTVPPPRRSRGSMHNSMKNGGLVLV